MRNMISRFMLNLKIEDVNNFALNKGINLNDDELNYTFNFIKKNWESVLANPNIFNLDRYKDHFNNDNFVKIKKLYTEYFQKFSNYL